MEIRIAENGADAASASGIYALGWKAGYRGIFSDALLAGLPLDHWTSHFTELYETRRFALAILSVDGEDVGAGAYGLSRDYEGGDWGEVTSLYFLEKVWGRGYAAPLMGFMLDRLKEQGCKRCHVWVLKENRRARRFYEKAGFLPTGGAKDITIQGETKTNLEYAR